MERSVMAQISTLESQQEGLQRALEEAREAALKGRAEAAERESCLRRELDSAVTEYAGEEDYCTMCVLIKSVQCDS